MILRPFLYEPSACASHLFGCTTHGRLAVVDPHVAGALAGGLTADALGAAAAIETVAVLTAASGIWVARTSWAAGAAALWAIGRTDERHRRPGLAAPHGRD